MSNRKAINGNPTMSGPTDKRASGSVTFGSGVLGPTAVGSTGVAATARRSDQTAAAYRSDTLSATWFIDPVNGSDASNNAGTTSATALRTMRELCKRWWGYHFTSNTTVNVLGNIPNTDINFWHFTVAPGILVTFLGNLGATTGFGGAAIDNTLYSGSVTGFTGAANVPTADDIQLTDTAIPVSYTASGLLASGVIFRRETGGTAHWYALKDLGAKTIRMTSPTNNTQNNTWATLTVGNTYKAYALCQWPTQYFGQAAGQVLCDTFYDIGPAIENTGAQMPRRRRVWLGTQTTARQWGFGGWVNCLLEVGASVICNGIESMGVDTGPLGGGARGNGASTISILRGTVMGACWVGQGVQLAPNDNIMLALENGMMAMHDATVPLFAPTNGACIHYTTSQAGTGISGKGNTSKLFSTSNATEGSFVYNFSGATPPFTAASTSDGSPITVNGVSYALSALPALANVEWKRLYRFPLGGQLKFSGAIETSPGGATTAYLADSGQFVTGNLPAQRYPTSGLVMWRLRATKLVGAGVVTNNVTLTLYKNGVATAMTVTILAADAQFTKYVDAAHPIVFADGDDYDLRLDDGADVLGGVLIVSATLDWG